MRSPILRPFFLWSLLVGKDFAVYLHVIVTVPIPLPPSPLPCWNYNHITHNAFLTQYHTDTLHIHTHIHTRTHATHARTHIHVHVHTTTQRNLQTNVSASNVFAILRAADAIGASEMKAFALGIIVKHFPKVTLPL